METTIVTTPYGPVVGLDRESTKVFKGIRFARAARFQDPVAITSWDGELDATALGAQCHQIPGILDNAFGSGTLASSEDCLFLNVVTPATDQGARPVLFWIHGGAFVNGSGSTPWYDGSALARRADVVVVTINYRLGAFGFLGDRNLGTRDQLTALRWVQACIGSFGGDPDNVTIFGESAGGSAVVSLLATPMAGGLFHHAFAMSPSITQLRDTARAAEAEAQFLDAAGVTSRDEAMGLSPEEMLAAQQTLLRDAASAFTAFSPTSGTDLIPGPVGPAAAANPVPFAVGTTRDEMQMFTVFDPSLTRLTDEGLLAMVAGQFGTNRVGEALDVYRAARPGATNGGLASAIQTDAMFRVPARELAEDRVAAGTPTWMYWFTWASTAFDGALGSCHAIDVPFAFHNLHKTGVVAFTGDSPEREEVADSYADAITGLATTGRCGWAPYDIERRATLRVDAAAAVVDDPERDIRLLWQRRR